MHGTRSTRLGNPTLHSSNLHSLRTADARHARPFPLAGLCTSSSSFATDYVTSVAIVLRRFKICVE